MDFVALDIETANADISSICQIGIAHFRNGEICATWKSNINPETFFDPVNVSIHGIDESFVSSSPTFSQIGSDVFQQLSGKIVVTHTQFDRASMTSALSSLSFPLLESSWLDTAKVARRAWSEVSAKGYGLANLCKRLGIEFKHHDALEDAIACGQVLLAAIDESKIELEDWLERVTFPMTACHSGETNDQLRVGQKISRDGNISGPFFGEVIAFTGALSMTRREAADLASLAGCAVVASVTKKTTILCVGDRDVDRFVSEKSAKQIKAEDLIRKGGELRIIREADFKKMLTSS